MKTSVISLIRVYQIVISPLLGQLLGLKTICRYHPTCSVYAQQMIQKHGIIQGSRKSLKRILSCQPFAKSP